MVNAAPWRHNGPQRYVFSGFFDYQVLVNKSPGNNESLCADLARICTLSVISAEALPSSDLVTQSPNLKKRTRYLQHSDGRVLCIDDWAIVSEVIDMFLIFSRSSAHFITRRPIQPSHTDSYSRSVAFLNNARPPTRELEARQLSTGNTLYSRLPPPLLPPMASLSTQCSSNLPQLSKILNVLHSAG